MLTTAKIAAQSARDYYGKMAKLSKGTSYWSGRGARALGHHSGDPINADELYALCAMGPSAAKKLEAGLPLNFSIDDLEAYQASLMRPRRPGFDLTFSAPKSLSLALLAHPDEATHQAIELAHWLAVNEALRFLQKKAGLSRVTVDGDVSIVPAEMIFAGFTHFTNRNIEPHLHTHVIVPNVVRCEDGKWRALDAVELYHWYMVAGALYRASLREHTQRLTNAQWVMADGWKYEISGLAEWRSSDGAELLPAFSLRHGEIVEKAMRILELTASEELSPKVKRSLGVRTRKAKDFGDGDANLDEVKALLTKKLEEVWKLGPEQWNAIFKAHDDPRPDSALAGLWLRVPQHLEAFGAIPLVENSEELVDYMAKVLFDEGGGRIREGVLSGKASVSVQDIHSAIYNFFGGFIDGEVLDDATKKLLCGGGSDPKLRLAPIVPALFVGGKHVKPQRAPISKYAPGGVLNTEAKVLQLAAIDTSSGVLDPAVVNDYLTQTIAAQTARGGHVLANEQQIALRHLLTSTTTATLLMGAQGSGKTTLFSHFAELAAANGTTVWGLAPQGTAVNKLGDTLRRIDPDAKAMTIESFVGKIQWGSLTVPENTCIILDESSQADTIELAEVLEIVANAGAKLILVGDDRQLGSVRYGGMFSALFAMVGGARLVETRRAADPWDRTAQSHLRMGDIKGALRIYEQKGRVSVVDDGLALLESAGEWLRKEFDEGTDSFVITHTKAEEMAANALAHEIWNEYRGTWLKNHLDTQVRHHRMSNKLHALRMDKFLNADPSVNVTFSGSQLTLRMGDLVAIRQSVKIDTKTWLSNGQRGRVVDISNKALTLFIQEESTARHITIPLDLIESRPGLLSYGWASTVFRTQAMELGAADGQVDIADEYTALTPDTPVLVKRSTHRSKTFGGTFLEEQGDKVSIRLPNGKIRRVAKSRISISSDTYSLIKHLAVEHREGNALVIGAEAMNLDSFLVAASRARQSTNFLFRSIMATENDLDGEQLVKKLSAQDIAEGESPEKALVRATMMLYLARQSRAEEPDSAYLQLAREREALTLATTVPLPMLESLRSWLSDNVSAGVLQITIDDVATVAQRDAAQVRQMRLRQRLNATSDLQYQEHLLAEIEGCDSEIAYAEREILQMKIFSHFIGHATSALGNSEGKVVVDERYVKDRLSLVDDAINMAENMDSWTEIPEGIAIEVPLPENTAREVVDVSSKDQVQLNTKAKLFESVSYAVASDWMGLANGLYDRMLADGLSMDEVLATIEVSDDNHHRLRESIVTVAVSRLHPTPVSHPVTLRGVRAESLSEDVDPNLVAFMDQITESISEHKDRRAERASFEQYGPDFADDADEGYDEIWDDYANITANDEGRRFVEGEAPEPEYGWEDDDAGMYAASEPTSEPAPFVPPTVESGPAKPRDKMFGEKIFGTWPDDPPVVGSESTVDKHAGASDESAQPIVVDNINEPMLGSPSMRGSIDVEVVGSREAAVIREYFLNTVIEGNREYHRGYFYKNPKGVWKADEKKRRKLMVEHGDVVHGELFAELFDMTEVIEISPGEIYIPSTETIAEAEKIRAERKAVKERLSTDGYTPGVGGPDQGRSKGMSPGYGKKL